MRELCAPKHINRIMAQSPENSLPTHTARWFALTVRHQHERQVAHALNWKGLETLVPCYPASRRWSDRTKEVETPLFGGYVFCRFELPEKVRVLNTPGVGKMVGFGGTPSPLEDREIDHIQAALRSELPLWPWQYLGVGDKVRIERGPLRGVEGTLLQEPEGFRLVIGVELLRRSIAVKVDAQMIAPLHVAERTEAAQIAVCGGFSR